MLEILDRFCDAYVEWDERSNVGDVYLTPIMQYLGGHARRGIPSDELGEYSVEDMREELQYLTGRIAMDAAFLVASLIRAIDAELVATSQAYEKSLETLPERHAEMERIFDQYGGQVPPAALQGMRDVLESAMALHRHPEGELRDDQARILAWREIMEPLLDRNVLEEAYRQQWGEDDA